MFWMRNEENSFPLGTLTWRPDRQKLNLLLNFVDASSKGPDETAQIAQSSSSNELIQVHENAMESYTCPKI